MVAVDVHDAFVPGDNYPGRSASIILAGGSGCSGIGSWLSHEEGMSSFLPSFFIKVVVVVAPVENEDNVDNRARCSSRRTRRIGQPVSVEVRGCETG